MIENDIRQFIVDELQFDGSTEGLPDDLPLIEKNVLDSLGLFHLVGYLESTYGIEVLDEELVSDHFGTIHNIAGFVRSKRG